MTMTNQEFIESIRLEGEEWRDVIGWEGLYMVSSFGRVASIRTEFYYKNRNKPRVVQPHLLKIQTVKMCNNLFYQQVAFYIHKTYKIFKVHKLVALAFIPNPENYPQVDHIDTDGTNNKVTNLRWCTASMNMMNPLTRAKNKLVENNHLGYRSKKVVCVSPTGDVSLYKSILEASLAKNINRETIRRSCIKKVIKSKSGLSWYYLSDYESLINQEVKEPSSED